MEKWTEDRVNKLIDMWGRFSPSEIGEKMHGVKFYASDIYSKAKELGLPCYVPKKPGPVRERVKLKARVLPDGMIELAPGHVCSRESYNLILSASEKHF